MSILLTEFALGADAVRYMREELANGHGLARHLLDLPLDQGSVSTHLPAGVSKADLLDFGSGGVGSGEENLRAAELIKERMSQAADGSPICVVEHPVASKGDRFLRRRQWPLFSVGDDVYLFAYAEEPIENVRRIVKEAHWYPGIGVASSLPSGSPVLTDGDEADPELLKTLAQRAQLIIVAAYDAEGWLVWHPPSRVR